MAIEGLLKELNIQDVLQLLSLANKTGVLSVRSDTQHDEAVIHFSKGEIVSAARGQSNRRLGQLLQRAGKLTPGVLHAALDIQRSEPDRRLAEILLEMGAVPRDELERQLRFQMEETLYELMGWHEGGFTFEERTEIAALGVIAPVRVESLLIEGARRSDEWTRFEAKVPGPESVPVLAPPVAVNTKPVELRTEEWEVLAEIDGERDIRQLAADLVRSAFDVAKTVFGLVNAGIVQVHDNNSRMRAATDAFSRAVGLDPQSPDAHFQLGLTALRTGDLERAGKAWETYLRLSGNGERRQLVMNALSAVKTLMTVMHRAKSLER